MSDTQHQQLPNGWLSTTIGEISSPKQWPTISQDVLSKSGYPVFGANGLIGYYTRFTHEKPTVAVTCRGSTCGTIHVTLPFSYITGNAMALDGLNEELVDTRFLVAILRFQGLRDCITGSAQPQIIGSDLRRVRISLPLINEQHRIAEILDTLDDAIQKTEQLINKLKQIKQGLLQDLLTRGIDENGQLRDPIAHPEQFKDSVLGRIPRAWKVKPLGEACSEGDGSIQTGPFGSQLHAEDYKHEGVPIITVEHLGDEKILHHNLPLVGEYDYKRLSRYVLATGDLVFSRVGAIDRCSYVSEQENGWLFSGRCLRVRVGSGVLYHRFMLYQLNSHAARQRILNSSVGSTMACLNTTILSRLPVLIPSINEQKHIASILDAHVRRINYEDRYLNKLQTIKQGLMHDLLTGKVRVQTYKEQG